MDAFYKDVNHKIMRYVFKELNLCVLCISFSFSKFEKGRPISSEQIYKPIHDSVNIWVCGQMVSEQLTVGVCDCFVMFTDVHPLIDILAQTWILDSILSVLYQCYTEQDTNTKLISYIIFLFEIEVRPENVAPIYMYIYLPENIQASFIGLCRSEPNTETTFIIRQLPIF